MNYAEALVDYGYADDINQNYIAIAHQCGEYGEDIDWEFRPVEWDKDTLEGRRQADALEDWLQLNHQNLWWESIDECDRPNSFPTHLWRLSRIKWCFEQLESR